MNIDYMIKKEESDLKLVEKLARELREDIRRLKKSKGINVRTSRK